MNNYCVYAHLNKVNGKYYIGITCRKPKIRWGKNGDGYKEQEKFYRAIQKYGWDNFDHIILAKNLLEDEALALETYYIQEYNSIENGYNILLNGIKSYPRHKTVYCLTTNELFYSIKAAAQSINTDPSKIIENCKGRCGPVKNTEWTYWDTMAACPMSKPRFIPKPKVTVPIFCIELNKTFNSIHEACRELNLDYSGMIKALNRSRNGIGGYHFVRESEKEKINSIMCKKTGKNTPVYCEETQQIFPSVQEAAIFANVSPQSIIKNCQGKTKTCSKKHFKYYVDLFKEGGEAEDV